MRTGQLKVKPKITLNHSTESVWHTVQKCMAKTIQSTVLCAVENILFLYEIRQISASNVFNMAIHFKAKVYQYLSKFNVIDQDTIKPISVGNKNVF